MCFYSKTGSVYVTQQAVGFTVNKQARGKVLVKRIDVHIGHVKNQDLSQVPETGEGKRWEKRKPGVGHLPAPPRGACFGGTKAKEPGLWGCFLRIHGLKYKSSKRPRLCKKQNREVGWQDVSWVKAFSWWPQFDFWNPHGREKQLLKVVFWLSHVCCGMCLLLLLPPLQKNSEAIRSKLFQGYWRSTGGKHRRLRAIWATQDI